MLKDGIATEDFGWTLTAQYHEHARCGLDHTQHVGREQAVLLGAVQLGLPEELDAAVHKDRARRRVDSGERTVAVLAASVTSSSERTLEV